MTIPIDRGGDALLVVEMLEVAFRSETGPVDAVQGISFSVSEGEKLALVGESGSGKSVTALTIMGLNDPLRLARLSGRILYRGEDLLRTGETRMRSLRGADIAMIFQEPATALNPVLTVGQQLIEPMRLHLGLDRKSARRRAVELLERTGVDRPAERLENYPHTMSGGQRQRVMIAMALACRPRLIIADEPTTALDVTVQRQVLELLASLQAEAGLAVMLISHDLNLVRRFADRLCVMERGLIVESASADDVFEHPKHPYPRRLIAARPEQLRRRPRPPSEQLGTLLEGTGLSCEVYIPRRRMFGAASTRAILSNVSVELRWGETVGVVGESGSGKSTLALCLLGLRAVKGEIYLDSERLDRLSGSALRRRRRDLGIVFQDPYGALSPRMTVAQIIAEGLQIHEPRMKRSERGSRVSRMLTEVGLDSSFARRHPHELSGGQRQRVAIARALILEPRLVVLDEPTSSLDVTVQQQVLELLLDLQAKHGMSYLFISHDLSVVKAVAHRVLVLFQGELVECGDIDQVYNCPVHPYTRRLLQAAL